MKQLRLRNFFYDLDQLLQNNEYHDDETETDVCDINEEEAYNRIMTKDEYHFIGEDLVREWIHVFMTDFSVRLNVLEAFK